MAYHHTVMGEILKLVSRREFEGEARIARVRRMGILVDVRHGRCSLNRA